MSARDETEYNYLSYKSKKLADFLGLQDQKIALKWIAKIDGYQSANSDLSQMRVDLMKNFLDVLKNEVFFRVLATKKAADFGESDKARLKMEIERAGDIGAEFPLINSVYKPDSAASHFMSIWSKDKKTYIAAKPLGGQGALVYLAVTSNPELGWDLPDPSLGHFQHPSHKCSP
ncbi:Hypothetical protein NTJ_08017 [Nesidiocoris tenuis]|uniref:Uncharacterized protein n=1 Tax=Nesidiocoris tenuis TaxID=355587 RepID=A0ABN7AT26_9HEMI|nr:Hypothetical protein NTJ_08017 [Nesidiocoris tenuis]